MSDTQGSTERQKQATQTARDAAKLRFLCELAPGLQILRDPHNIIIKEHTRRSYYRPEDFGSLLRSLAAIARSRHWGPLRRTEVQDLIRAEAATQATVDTWAERLAAGLEGYGGD